MYAAEAEGLRALRAAGTRAPEPFEHGVRDGKAFIEMERLELGGRADWPAMGRMLAALHRNTSDRFGWKSDNWIGLSPQKNGLSDDWAAFYRSCRLIPQLERAGLLKESEFLLKNLDSFFVDYQPLPSLLHGDLWGGNAGFTAEGPVIFDPAVYYGDREADLAMTELFGGFPREFYAAYNEAFPLPAEYEKRKHLYNLYHLLNHLNLFGGGYYAQVKATLGLLLRAF
jgi:protein-ribulosamine 3-kinase